MPHGNSPEKNRAMRAFGAELIEHGHDFQAAYEHAMALAERENLHPVRSFHPLLVRGVASYGLELFRAVPDLDIVYVPIGLGSGICGVIAAREALGLKTEIVGVVAANAATYALSFAAGKPVATNSADTFAGGLAVRVPDCGGARDHPPPRGAHRHGHGSGDARGDAHHLQRHAQCRRGRRRGALAAALQERDRLAGKRVAVVQSGGNIDRAPLRRDPRRESVIWSRGRLTLRSSMAPHTSC